MITTKMATVVITGTAILNTLIIIFLPIDNLPVSFYT
jgi:hypothetical protein